MKKLSCDGFFKENIIQMATWAAVVKPGAGVSAGAGGANATQAPAPCSAGSSAGASAGAGAGDGGASGGACQWAISSRRS